MLPTLPSVLTIGCTKPAVLAAGWENRPLAPGKVPKWWSKERFSWNSTKTYLIFCFSSASLAAWVSGGAASGRLAKRCTRSLDFGVLSTIGAASTARTSVGCSIATSAIGAQDDLHHCRKVMKQLSPDSGACPDAHVPPRLGRNGDGFWFSATANATTGR